MPSTSLNFEFLRPEKPELADLGRWVEVYVHSDPQSALVKARTCTEKLVHELYELVGLNRPPRFSLDDLLHQPAFKRLVPRTVLLKMDAVRQNGNKAAHGNTISAGTAQWILTELFELAKWYANAYLGQTIDSARKVTIPPETTAPDDLELTGQPDRETLEHRRAQAGSRDRAMGLMLHQSPAPAPVTPSLTNDVFESKARDAAEELEFDEWTTRIRLIDSQIALAGFDLNDPTQLKREVEVSGQDTATGMGYADYVIWDEDGKPLAVIEAKRTSESAEKGKTQARLYADGFEQDTGQRPIIFYTNGFDIWIWDDAQGYPPRNLLGFYSKDNLQYLLYQRTHKVELETIAIDSNIVDADRIFAHECIKRVSETFSQKHRRALIVQATGTGKTRIAIALSDVLVRANWAKRILFLCDRKELRKQAKNAFNDFTKLPLVEINKTSREDRNQRVYLGTYPALLRHYQSFDPGFFDLVIADESHRSIYNVYRDLFKYFDALQVGLTATPVNYVLRNTFSLFGCDNQNPTFNYDYESAVKEGYLVPFEVHTYQTGFQRKGIKYNELSEEQKEALEQQDEDPSLFEYSAKQLDSVIFNKDTNRHILRNLMENGIRDGSDQTIGKTIIFARSHKHALLLSRVFDEIYPQFGGRFCQVIDNYDPRAEQLIDDFKEPDNELTIAISVDMLDTGIDVPEIVNLVFAKPVNSPVKFWQMIGRGTRLCPALFGPDRDKSTFRIFDHWDNFDYFEFSYTHREPKRNKSLLELLFEARIDLAEAALAKPDPNSFAKVRDLITADIKQLPEESIAVREKWRVKRQMSKPEVIDEFGPGTVATLRDEIAVLMQWIRLKADSTKARSFDLLVTRLQIALFKGSSQFDDLKAGFMDQINNLVMHLNPVREKSEMINTVRSSEFWNSITFDGLEQARLELRQIIHHQHSGSKQRQEPKVVDIPEDQKAVQAARRSSSIQSIDMEVYRKQIEHAVSEIRNTDPTLQKIRRAETLSEKDIDTLVSLLHTRTPDVPIDTLREFYGTADALGIFFRTITGLETDVVEERFGDFMARYPNLTADQTQFLRMIKGHLSEFGVLKMERLYDAPFTQVHESGIDSVFPDEIQLDAVLTIIRTFSSGHPSASN